jgi:hypothetical protein
MINHAAHDLRQQGTHASPDIIGDFWNGSFIQKDPASFRVLRIMMTIRLKCRVYGTNSWMKHENG